MECGRFVEEKLGDAESPEFRDHLAGCEACRRDREEIREVRRLYRVASVERYPGGVPRVGRRRALPWIPAAAAAAVMLALLGLLLWVPSPPPDDAATNPTLYTRVHLEPWSEDARLSNAMDDAWRKLEMLEQEW